MNFSGGIGVTAHLDRHRLGGIQLRHTPFVSHSQRKAFDAVKKQRRLICSSDLNSTLQSLSTPPISTALGLAVLAAIATTVIVGSKSMAALYPQLVGGSAETGGKRADAVLVFGSTGKMGRAIVRELLQSGRPVVAASRSLEKGKDILSVVGENFNGKLTIEGDVDITNPSSLSKEKLWKGVSQIAIAVGPVFGRQDNGEMGYKENMTAERVDSQGVSNIVEAAKKFLPNSKGPQSKTVLSIKTAKDLKRWDRLDDVIMGGQSSSSLQASESGTGSVWSGDLVMEGGGFCGTRIKDIKLDLSGYDGIALRIKGDGQTYKLNVKTDERGDNPESTYAATFETADGDWQNIFIPFREFVGVTRAKFDPTAGPLNPSKVRQIGFRLSRFDFNNLANPSYRPGPFRLEIEDGIKAYKDVKPSIVVVSSAAVERNAVIGDDAEARKKDIPIVQLNPGGILNYKYMGEFAVRTSGYPYTVIRPVGLTTEQVEESFLLEASQGDTISGKISREEAASVVAASLQTPASRGKTLEVRRNEAVSSKGKKSSPADLERLFLGAIEDWHRPRRSLPPLPSVVPPPPPPSEERVKEILEIPEVKAVAQRARDRVSAENKQKDTRHNNSSSNGAEINHEASQNGAGSSQPEAKEWIRSWREDSKEKDAVAR